FGAETRVAAQTHAATAVVGDDTPVSPMLVGVQASVSYDGTSGCCVAPNSAVAGLGDDAFQFAIRTEKLDHIFVPKRNLDPLVSQLGSREAVVQQMLNGVSGRTPAAGVFELTTDIAGQQVVVRGAVVDGVGKLGTAFTP
ncbi:MAG: hypothetical protein GY701_35715, partial [Sulfitobacter sp.]|nr:hypothetical protein [Sulfitobacter sp.]